MAIQQDEHVLALLERLSRIIHNDAGGQGLKPAQWEALRFFAQANRFSRTPSALTAYMGITKGTVSQTLSALERKGFIEKVQDTGDRRSVSIALTKAGKSLLQDDPLQALSQPIMNLQKNKRKELSSSLSSVLATALEQRSGMPFGVCKSCKYFKRNVTGGNPHQCSLLEVPLSSEDSELICREQVSS